MHVAATPTVVVSAYVSRDRLSVVDQLALVPLGLQAHYGVVEGSERPAVGKKKTS